MSERVRVLLLSPHVPPTRGGIADHTRWLAQELAQVGFEMRVLTSASPAPIPISTIAMAPTLEHWDRRLWRAVADEVNAYKPAILHIQYQQSMYGGDPAIGFLPWALMALGARAATITTLHDMGRPTRGPSKLAFESLVYGSDRLTVSNASEFLGLAKRPGIKRRTTIVSVGSNIEVHPLAREQKTALRASITGDANACLLVFFGLIRPGKGLEALIDAVADLRQRNVQVELVVIGDVGNADVESSTAYRDQTTARAHDRGLDGVVHFLGHQPEPKASHLLQASDLAVLPFEAGASASNATIFAALSHGVPLLSTRGPGTPRTFTDGTLELIDSPPDAMALSRAIEGLIRHPEKRESMARRGRQLADGFTHSAIARQIASIYESLLD